MLSQFTGEEGDRTLADFSLPKEVYAAGRLDKDSEGLLLLTNDGPFLSNITNPKFNKEKTYHVQVEGVPSPDDIAVFENGVVIKGKITKPAKCRILEGYELPPRRPPIRERKNIPTSWLEVKLKEGRNRQVRRMCAAIGFPCLRLLRVKIGILSLGKLEEGEWCEVKKEDILSQTK